jgi:hypothetical protein
MFGILNIIVCVLFDNSNMFYLGEMVGLDIERFPEFRKASYRLRQRPDSAYQQCAQGAVDIVVPLQTLAK